MMSYIPKLSDPALIKAATALAPAIVRVGGITADWVTYVGMDAEDGGGASPPQQSPSRTGSRLADWPTRPNNLTMTDFSTLLSFFEATGLLLLFDLNELAGRDCQTINPVTKQPAWCVGPWDTANVRAFLQYVHDQHLVGQQLIGFEVRARTHLHTHTHTADGGPPPLHARVRRPVATPRPPAAAQLGNELITHLDPTNNTEDILTLASIVATIWADTPPGARPVVWAPSTDSCST